MGEWMEWRDFVDVLELLGYEGGDDEFPNGNS